MKKILSVLLIIVSFSLSTAAFAEETIDEKQAKRVGYQINDKWAGETCLGLIKKDFECIKSDSLDTNEGCWCEINDYTVVNYVVEAGVIDVVVVTYANKIEDGFDDQSYTDFAIRACNFIGVENEENMDICMVSLPVILQSFGYLSFRNNAKFDIFVTFGIDNNDYVVFYIAFFKKGIMPDED